MHHALQPLSRRPRRALLLVALSLAAAAPDRAAAQVKVAEITPPIGARRHTGAIAFSPDGKTLALPGRGDGSVVELWSLETGKARILRSSFNKENMPCTDRIAFSRDGRCLAVEHHQTGVTVWDLDSGNEQAHVPMPAPKSWVNGLAFADGHRTLVAILTVPSGKEARVVNDVLEIRNDHSVIRWDVATDKNAGTFVFDPFFMFRAISPNGRYAVLQHRKGQDIFDLTTDRRVCTIDDIGGFVFSEDGSTLSNSAELI
jgi:WD40 repeat protein